MQLDRRYDGVPSDDSSRSQSAYPSVRGALNKLGVLQQATRVSYSFLLDEFGSSGGATHSPLGRFKTELSG